MQNEIKFFEKRDDIINYLPKNLKIAELGVFRGDFSKTIYKINEPSQLYLVDIFEGITQCADPDGNNLVFIDVSLEMHKLQEYFQNDNSVKIIKNKSINFLESIDDNFLDMVYIDNLHDYESVKNDLILSYRKVKQNGYICGHDFNFPEVSQAVNEFCQNFNLKINFLSKEIFSSFCIIKTQ